MRGDWAQTLLKLILLIKQGINSLAQQIILNSKRKTHRPFSYTYIFTWRTGFDFFVNYNHKFGLREQKKVLLSLKPIILLNR
ncbi:hypothetical protein BpHYR1_037852 [Brachionus plicatilis]|uniref:Uncharacterized protein n=1 Tax=Brachionus plicatilis TaxID=10195 RepID=A0A3M7RQU3_BRAPC|nr:hypothetical protein BpHYR1_037852 [Brachionus plicatilis]